MLIGSDLSIFGDEQHSAISLRLRHMNKSINALTGINRWLNDLMCNVLELAMCYHVDAIIQLYEIIKTEDILYSNTTKAEYIYWSCKGLDDDIVTLYDLTNLCETDHDDNLYTLPVATLLYTMTHNIVSNSDYETCLEEPEIENHEQRLLEHLNNECICISQDYPSRANEFQQRLEQLLEHLYQYYYDSSNADAWLGEQELYTMSEERGKDELTTQTFIYNLNQSNLSLDFIYEHNVFRTEESHTRRKHLHPLVSLHYETALKLFSPNDNPLESLRLLIEEVPLADVGT
ncbi:unnamed protein product [Rotaria sp. Silwood1]|nr:unnamed protein product [Rotaria sp. Silwood1]CAF5104135.1 unnamed protein product [Rotaria sp. Silwood1]